MLSDFGQKSLDLLLKNWVMDYLFNTVTSCINRYAKLIKNYKSLLFASCFLAISKQKCLNLVTAPQADTV
jgi:hypothetical protein